jgi:hypothetical protein
MQPDLYITENKIVVIDENGSLNQFYSLTEAVSKSRHVRFTGKNDEADNIEWNFKYHGHPLTLQYNIYNGVSMFIPDSKDIKSAEKLLEKIKAKKRA